MHEYLILFADGVPEYGRYDPSVPSDIELIAEQLAEYDASDEDMAGIIKAVESVPVGQCVTIRDRRIARLYWPL